MMNRDGYGCFEPDIIGTYVLVYYITGGGFNSRGTKVRGWDSDFSVRGGSNR
jgi:hypothetical protein